MALLPFILIVLPLPSYGALFNGYDLSGSQFLVYFQIFVWYKSKWAIAAFCFWTKTLSLQPRLMFSWISSWKPQFLEFYFVFLSTISLVCDKHICHEKILQLPNVLSNEMIGSNPGFSLITIILMTIYEMIFEGK